MIIQLSIEIERSAEECWAVFGGKYAEISVWKAGMKSSEAEGEPFGDAPYGSRKLKASGLTFSEKLVHFSNAERAFTYEVVGLPFVISSARNEWHFSGENGKATLHMKLNLQILNGFGWLLGGLLKKNMTKEMGKLLEEFKFYMENGKPHPRKQRELRKGVQHAL
ncbi:MAG: SRPBCC family protein [Flavobacteriales bacterium]|nr:SRPBCC family protein [Flavobacteriales bacterium]